MREPLVSPQTGTTTAAAVMAMACLLGLAGCSGFGASGAESSYLDSLRRQQWWESVRHNTSYVDGRGYYLAETDRYYDDNGREVTSSVPLIDQASYQESTSEDQISVFDHVTPSGLAESARSLTGRGPNEQAARDLYEQGETIYRAAMEQQGDERSDSLKEAADLFESSTERWGRAPLNEDSLYMWAESLFFGDRYAAASTAYQELIKRYPSTRYLDVVDARRFAMAQYWLALDEEEEYWLMVPNFTDSRRPLFDTHGSGVNEFVRIIGDDPTGELADDATIAAANAHFAAGNYAEADRYYADLRQSYPASPHQFQAHLLGVKTSLMLYLGPDYSSAPLDQAEQLIRAIHRYYAEEAQPELEYLTRAMAEVRLKQAERQWRLARFYDRRSEYGSARIYYERLRSEYDDTSLAAEAEARLAEIGTRPDQPTQRAAWLLRWFDRDDPAVPEQTRMASEQPIDPR